MKYLFLVGGAAALLVCAGCSMIGNEAAANVVRDMVAKGTITPDQGQTMIDALQAASGIRWDQWLLSLISSVVLGTPVALGAVRAVRGPATPKAARVKP